MSWFICSLSNHTETLILAKLLCMWMCVNTWFAYLIINTHYVCECVLIPHLPTSQAMHCGLCAHLDVTINWMESVAQILTLWPHLLANSAYWFLSAEVCALSQCYLFSFLLEKALHRLWVGSVSVYCFHWQWSFLLCFHFLFCIQYFSSKSMKNLFFHI